MDVKRKSSNKNNKFKGERRRKNQLHKDRTDEEHYICGTRCNGPNQALIDRRCTVTRITKANRCVRKRKLFRNLGKVIS